MMLRTLAILLSLSAACSSTTYAMDSCELLEKSLQRIRVAHNPLSELMQIKSEVQAKQLKRIKEWREKTDAQVQEYNNVNKRFFSVYDAEFKIDGKVVFLRAFNKLEQRKKAIIDEKERLLDELDLLMVQDELFLKQLADEFADEFFLRQ